MKNFEEKLEKLEYLTNNIKRPDISLEEALKNFEEGIKLAKTLEKQIDEIEIMKNLKLLYCQKQMKKLVLQVLRKQEQDNECKKSCKNAQIGSCKKNCSR